MHTNSAAYRIFRTAVRLALAPSLFSILLSPTLLASDLQEPITLTSHNGVLDLLMIAKPGPINTLASQAPGGTAPTGWVYEICERPAGGTFACPVGTAAPNYYGGTLLQLSKGDTLKIHLVNQLPKVADSKHAGDTDQAFLALNPTNLHTHGMLVSPNGPTATDPTYGDNIFVLTFNSANGTPVQTPHVHSTIRMDSTDYKIKIPENHPSGLFWFHPHTHGISLNQVSAGLGGIITVGSVSDYVSLSPTPRIRHIILKDTQILAKGTLMDQEDPGFCAPSTAGAKLTPLPGFCAGNGTSDDGTISYTGGKWFFTLNGQINPSIPVNSAGGEIWRIANVSGSATYHLNLWNPQQNRQMLMQVISIDGVSVKPTRSMTMGQLTEIGGTKFVPVNCPGFNPATPSPSLTLPICTRILHMMPSARAEVWVTYRDRTGKVANPKSTASAIFRTDGYTTGPSGDSWPPVDLASVSFQTSSLANRAAMLNVKGEVQDLQKPVALARDMSAANKLVAPDNSCKALPPHHTRRIFYGVPSANQPNTFGLAYEELDENGAIVGPKATDLIPFDPMHETICVPLGPNNQPVTERWQLVNVATEDHNFHIHQTKFRLVGKDELGGTTVPEQGVTMDNVPLPHATGTCGVNPPTDSSNPIDDFRSGVCKTMPITVDIPFAIAGDFVYHCHILEHEDGGMMARIRVRPTQ